MLRRTSPATQLGYETIDPAPRYGQTSHVLSLAGRNAARGSHGLVALIAGESEAVERARAALAGAFKRGSGLEKGARGEEERYVETVLAELEGASAALALRVGRDLVIGCSGDAQAFLCRGGGVNSLGTALPSGVGRASPDTSRLRVEIGDRLILTDGTAAGHLQLHELRATQDFEAQAHATWLATVAASRSGRLASVVAIQFVRRAGMVARLVRRLSLGPGHSAGVAALGAAGLALLAVAIAFLRSALASSSAAPPGAPAGLQTLNLTSKAVTLAWQPVAGASAYGVRVGGRQYWTAAPRLTVAGSLRPGRAYAWRVQARAQGRIGPFSAAATVRLPFPPFPVPTRFHWQRVRWLDVEGKISLCWRSAGAAEWFDVSIVGGDTQIERRLSSPAHAAGATVTQCLSQALQPGIVYAWRVGAVAPGYTESWTVWKHFLVQEQSSPATNHS